MPVRQKTQKLVGEATISCGVIGCCEVANAAPTFSLVGSVVEWLKHRTDDQHGLGSKPTCAILLCPWERHFTALSPAWWS